MLAPASSLVGHCSGGSTLYSPQEEKSQHLANEALLSIDDIAMHASLLADQSSRGRGSRSVRVTLATCLIAKAYPFQAVG